MLLNLFKGKRFLLVLAYCSLQSQLLIDVFIIERKRSDSEYRKNKSKPSYEDCL